MRVLSIFCSILGAKIDKKTIQNDVFFCINYLEGLFINLVPCFAYFFSMYFCKNNEKPLKPLQLSPKSWNIP